MKCQPNATKTPLFPSQKKAPTSSMTVWSTKHLLSFLHLPCGSRRAISGALVASQTASTALSPLFAIHTCLIAANLAAMVAITGVPILLLFGLPSFSSHYFSLKACLPIITTVSFQWSSKKKKIGNPAWPSCRTRAVISPSIKGPTNSESAHLFGRDGRSGISTIWGRWYLRGRHGGLGQRSTPR